MHNNTSLFNNTNTANSNEVTSLVFKFIAWGLPAVAVLTVGFFLGRYMEQSSDLSKKYPKMLADAISQGKKETDGQIAEVKAIFRALKEFNHESGFFFENNLKKKRLSSNGFFEDATEKPPLLMSREKEEVLQQIAALEELMKSYPISGFESDPGLKTLEDYLEERRTHHAKIVEIAGLLLPNLEDLLRAARNIQETQVVQNKF